MQEQPHPASQSAFRNPNGPPPSQVLPHPHFLITFRETHRVGSFDAGRI